MASITCIRGDDKKLTLNFTDSNGDPIDLTDVRVDFTVKKECDLLEPDDTNSILKKTNTSHIDPMAGITEFDLTNQDTDIVPSTYYYDIQIKNVDGTIQSIEKDLFIVVSDVTKNPQLSS